MVALAQGNKTTLAVNHQVEGIPWFSNVATAPLFFSPERKAGAESGWGVGRGCGGGAEASAGVSG